MYPRHYTRAEILLFDVSVDSAGRRNGNVMYELGIAHSIRYPEEIVIIRSDTDPLLFDVSNVRVHNYDQSALPEMVETLAGMLHRLQREIDATKSLVLNRMASMLDEVMLGFMHAHAKLQYFSLKEPEKAFDPTTIEVRTGLRRMLEMGVISVVWKGELQRYAYTWTNMGVALLRKMGFLGLAKPDDWI